MIYLATFEDSVRDSDPQEEEDIQNFTSFASSIDPIFYIFTTIRSALLLWIC